MLTVPSATSLTANNPWVTAGTIAGDCSTTDVDKCTKLATNCIGTKIFYRDGSIDDW